MREIFFTVFICLIPIGEEMTVTFDNKKKFHQPHDAHLLRAQLESGIWTQVCQRVLEYISNTTSVCGGGQGVGCVCAHMWYSPSVPEKTACLLTVLYNMLASFYCHDNLKKERFILAVGLMDRVHYSRNSMVDEAWISCLRPLSSFIQFMWGSYPYSGNLPSSLRHLSAYLMDTQQYAS